MEFTLMCCKRQQRQCNVDKFKIMHIGGKNPKYEYNMNGTKLTETKEEKDLGVIIDCRLEFDRHIKNIVARANRTLGMIRISFECMDKSMFLNLYKGLVRPLLEYRGEQQDWCRSSEEYSTTRNLKCGDVCHTKKDWRN